MRVSIQSPEGMQLARADELQGGEVAVDADRPLRGSKTLPGVTFSIQVTALDVRAATRSEPSHGHVHGPSGHSH